MVGISPHGHIMFISKAFGRFIVQKSGFLNYLLSGDEVMADQGFTIEDPLFPVVLNLMFPHLQNVNPNFLLKM
jgi:hypothetical protein